MEHIDVLSEIFFNGIKRTKMDSKKRKELTMWWKAECEFIKDDLKATKNE